MISYLKGYIKTIFQDSVILVTNNIGYRVYLNDSYLLTLTEDQEIDLFIYQSISEYSNTLFGFKGRNELEFFEKLISVSGVGPKMAMNILNSPIETIKHAIRVRDLALLTEFPGIGRKTAERLCVELQNKLLTEEMEIISKPKIHTEDTSEEKNADTYKKHSTPLCNEEAFLALQSLGFSRLEAHRMISRVPSNVYDSEEIVRVALKYKDERN